MIGNVVCSNKVFIKMCRDNRYNYIDTEALTIKIHDNVHKKTQRTQN